jgi:hypothetical protein
MRELGGGAVVTDVEDEKLERMRKTKTKENGGAIGGGAGVGSPGALVRRRRGAPGGAGVEGEEGEGAVGMGTHKRLCSILAEAEELRAAHAC